MDSCDEFRLVVLILDFYEVVIVVEAFRINIGKSFL